MYFGLRCQGRRACCNSMSVLRPAVLQALQHPWLRGGAEDRSTGKALSLKVVQRIQVNHDLLP